MIICSFSDLNKPLNEAPKRLNGRKLHRWLLKNLKSRKRVCIWEIGGDIRVCIP